MQSSKPLKVLQVSPLDLGGTAKTMQLFTEHLDKKTFFPVVWSPAEGPRAGLLREKGIRIIIGPSLEEAVRRFKPHIVHVHRAGWPQPELLLPIQAAFRPDPAGLRSRLPVLIETNVFGRYDESESGRLIDVTLFVSHFCAERLRIAEERNIESPRYQVLYNPVDTDAFVELSPPPGQRDYSRPVFGRLSRPDPGKWSMLTLEALPLVKREIPDFTFMVIGGIPEAEMFVQKHKLQNNVRFLPPVITDGEIAAFMNCLTVFTHANKTGESFGVAIAEAMACGLPVITHNAEGWRDNAQVELVKHGQTGFVADTPQDYAKAIITLLRQPVLCRNMGMAGRLRAQLLFRAQDIARKLEQIYKEALEVCKE